MRAEISKLQTDLGVTTIYVTHDQIEAMTMGDRVAVMRKGELQQVDEPQVLYDRPVNLFVGGFIGSPAMNMLNSRIERANGGLIATVGSQKIALGDETLSTRPALRGYEGKDVVIGIRPEDLEDAALERDVPEDRTITGTLELREALGAEIMAHMSIDATAAETEDTRELARDMGDESTDQGVAVPEGKTIIVGRFGARSRVKTGDEVRAAVDTRTLHFFDPETGDGIYDGQDPKGATG
jgi:multiple sugar transport system ATP-binding protein